MSTEAPSFTGSSARACATCSLAALKALLGHSNFQMTLRYAHLAPDHLRAEMLKTESTADSSAHDQHTAPRTALPAAPTLISSGVTS
jgi:hypothetical protein